MLPRKSRIRAIEFNTLLKTSRQIHGRLVSLSYMPMQGISESRFAIVVPKTVSKKAVDRNRIRRQGYAAIRNLGISNKKGFICVFFFKKGSLRILYASLEEEFLSLLRKAQII